MDYFGIHVPNQAQNGAQQSATLPRGFVFNYTDSPKTPEPTEPLEPPQQPPNPPKIRIKRRRGPVPPFESMQESLDSRDPIPTIELPDADDQLCPPLHESTRDTAPTLLSASRLQLLQPLMSPPKTPAPPEMDAGATNRPGLLLWAQQSSFSSGHSISRPSSAFSDFSDSSASSVSSSLSPRSVGDSCTSPESEATDPFVFPKIEDHRKPLSSPVHFDAPPSRKRRRTQPNVKWTNELDEHLWMTYMAYLSDPTVTPFKMLPGTAPPLGVCHRVARQAKKTWRGPRPVLGAISEHGGPRFESLDATVMRHASMPPAGEADDSVQSPPWPRSHSSNDMRKAPNKWPKSGSSTRRRLRELCKRRPALSPHYSRLMKSRSPSPFESSSSQPRNRSGHSSSPPPRRSEVQSSFSTRDLHFNLTTSTAASMQPNGPLPQITSEAQMTDAQTPKARVFAEPSRSIPRSSAHQKSQSLQLGLELGTGPLSELRQLASPFVPRPTWPQRSSSSSTLQPTSEAGQENGTGPTLASPLQIHAPRPMSGSMKRRAQYQLGEELLSGDPDARRNLLEDLFPHPITNGNRRVRSRGFSMGAMRQRDASHNAPPSRPLAEIFTPPSTQESEQMFQHPQAVPSLHLQEAPHVSEAGGNSQLQPPNSGFIQRLGSPFAPTRSNASLSNTFPRSLFPNGLDSITAFEMQGQQQQSDAPRDLSSMDQS